MSKPPLANNSARKTGFTLIELLVVIGIIVLLLGLALPAVLHSYKTGVKTRQLADITLIGTALEAYKADFGDYPRFDNDKDLNTLNVTINRGAILLCRALVAPGPQTDASGGMINFGWDGAPGNGFRTRPGGAGTVYGPYVQPDRFQLSPQNDPNYSTAMILDRFGNPILYFPATPGATNVTSTDGYVFSAPPTGYAAAPLYSPLYNTYDANGITSSSTFLSSDIYTILGASSTTGAVSTSATTTQAYLLWSAGPDGIFGFPTNQPTKTDDITNFSIPSQYVK